MSSVQSAQRKSKAQAKTSTAQEQQAVSTQSVNVSTATVEVNVAPTTSPAPVQTSSSTPAKRQTKKTKTVQETAPETATPATVVAETTTVATAEVATVQTVSSESDSNEQPTVETEEQVDGTFSSYDDVVKAVNEVDREILRLYRKRAQLNKFGYKMYGQLSKQLRKRTKTDGRSTKRPVSGFNKPVPVPASFCAYLKLDASVDLPRTSVTALLYKHIKDNNMLDQTDKRKVIASPELRTLLHMKEDENLRFENFQHFVSRVYKAVLPENANSSASE
jgi:hypothetical protein